MQPACGIIAARCAAAGPASISPDFPAHCAACTAQCVLVNYHQLPYDSRMITPPVGVQLMLAAHRAADLLCDSARLDDWMREVPSGATPASFTAAQPPKRRASETQIYAMPQCAGRCTATLSDDYRWHRHSNRLPAGVTGLA